MVFGRSVGVGADVGTELAVAEVTVTVARSVVDNTFSPVKSPEAIDKTCVAPGVVVSNIIFGETGAVAAVARSLSIAILVFVTTTLVGSAPMDREIIAFPVSYLGSSITVVKVFGGGAAAKLSADRVANFAGSKLTVSLTKET